MTRNFPTLALALVVIVVIAGCTTTTSAPATAAAKNPEFSNVQVLPHTLSRQELIAVMRTFTRGLGVKCNHCHVVTATEPEEKLDFPSDAKEEKRVARVMIRMANQINGEWLERVERAEGHTEPHVVAPLPAEQRVWCWTCHRGKTEPEMPPPPPPRTP